MNFFQSCWVKSYVSVFLICISLIRNKVKTIICLKVTSILIFGEISVYFVLFSSESLLFFFFDFNITQEVNYSFVSHNLQAFTSVWRFFLLFSVPKSFFFFIMWFIFSFYDFWILIHIEKLSYTVVVVFLLFWTSFSVFFKNSYSLIFVLILWPIWNSSRVGYGIRLQFFVCPPHGCSVVPQHILNNLFFSTHFRCHLYQILVLLCI